MMMDCAGSVISSSHVRGVELSEAVCSIEFNSDECTASSHDIISTSTSTSQTSSDAQFGISCKTISYDEGISSPDVRLFVALPYRLRRFFEVAAFSLAYFEVISVRRKCVFYFMCCFCA